MLQARELARHHGVRLDRTERVANSLGKLAGTVTRFNAELAHDVKVRRASRSLSVRQQRSCSRLKAHQRDR